MTLPKRERIQFSFLVCELISKIGIKRCRVPKTHHPIKIYDTAADDAVEQNLFYFHATVR